MLPESYTARILPSRNTEALHSSVPGSSCRTPLRSHSAPKGRSNEYPLQEDRVYLPAGGGVCCPPAGGGVCCPPAGGGVCCPPAGGGVCCPPAGGGVGRAPGVGVVGIALFPWVGRRGPLVVVTPEPRNILAIRQSAASDPASQVVPFARKSSVRREPNVEPSCEFRFPNAPPTPPPLLG